MNAEKLMKKLTTEKSGTYEKIIAEYIVWQLGRMSNRELAETTAEEIEKDVFTMSGVFSEVTKGARAAAGKGACACLTSDEVFRLVRKALKIDSAIPEVETVGFIPGIYASQPVTAAPIPDELPKAAISLDLDELF